MDGDSDIFAEAATRGVLWKKVFLEISQNSQENTCVRASFLIKLQAQACNFIKKETLTQVLPYEFCEILRAPFLQNTSGRLLLGFYDYSHPMHQRVLFWRLLKIKKHCCEICFSVSVFLFLCFSVSFSFCVFWKSCFEKPEAATGGVL